MCKVHHASHIKHKLILFSSHGNDMRLNYGLGGISNFQTGIRCVCISVSSASNTVPTELVSGYAFLIAVCHRGNVLRWLFLGLRKIRPWGSLSYQGILVCLSTKSRSYKIYVQSSSLLTAMSFIITKRDLSCSKLVYSLSFSSVRTIILVAQSMGIVYPLPYRFSS